MNPRPPHLTNEQFRELGYRMVDWIADYWNTVDQRPVLSRVKPGETAAKLPPSAPETGAKPGEAGEVWDAIFRDLESIILPGLTHWQHPNFYAFFPANVSAPAVLGDLLSSGLGVQGMLWATSPACTEVETRVLDWLGELIGLPSSFLSSSLGGGVIEGTASESTLAAMVAARRRVLRKSPDVDSSRLVAYASSQAHSSVVKGAMIAGIISNADDRRRLRLIDTDDTFRMRPEALADAIRADLASGLIPFFVCATIGTTGVTAVDPVGGIYDAIARCGSAAADSVWLHVDAAHAGAACVCPEFRWMLDGIAQADSFCFNPHKWLLTNFDCGCLWTRDRASLIDSMSVTPEYLRNSASESGRVIDYRDWHIPLGRRFRSLKLWFVMRHYGAEGLRAFVREHINIAAEFESLVRDDPSFDVLAPRTMNLVCFRPRPAPREPLELANQRTRSLMEAVNSGGRAYLTHTVLPDGVISLRMAIGGVFTERHHVRETWELIRSLARNVDR